MISPSASSPDLSGISPYVFRVCPSDLQHGPHLARFALQVLGARRAGIISVNNDYGRGVRRPFAGELARLGGTVVEADPYVPTTPSLEPYLSHMRRGGVDVLLLAAERPGAELALREMRALGLAWPVLGGDALTGIEADGPLAEGVRLSSAYLPDRRDERNAAFVTDYARAYQGERPDHRGAGAYDAVFLLARAVDEAGAARRAIRAYLAGVGHGRAAFDGVTGTIVFDTSGDVPAKSVVIGVVRDGRLVAQAEEAFDYERRLAALGGLVVEDRLAINRLRHLHATIETEYAIAHALTDLGRQAEAVARVSAVRPQAAELTRLVRDLSRRQADKATQAAERLAADSIDRERKLWVLVVSLLLVGFFLSRCTPQSGQGPLGRPVP